MIKRVRIKNYKSLRDVELYLEPITVIMGPNASGKSNLLDALSLLSKCATSQTINKAFEEHRGEPLESVFNYPYGSDELIEGFGKISFEVDVELSKDVIDNITKKIYLMRKPYEEEKNKKPKKVITETFMRYRLSIRIDYETGHVGVIDEIAQAMRKDGTDKKQGRNPFLEKVENKFHLRMEGQSHPKYFDIGLDHTILSTPFYTPHHPHLAALREEFSRWKFFYLEPKTLMREINPVKEVRTIGPRGENLAAFYNTLKASNKKQFDNISLAMAQIIPDLLEVKIERLKSTGDLLLEVLEKGGKRSSRIVSEGTLRLLGLAAIINSLERLSVIGYEEPENGVHPRRIILLAKWFKNAYSSRNTQWIINTHSPLLAKQFDDKQLFICDKDPQGTKFTPFASSGLLFRTQEIETAFEERIIRGDFGG